MRRSWLFAAASALVATTVVAACSTSHATGSPGASDAGAASCPFANPVAAARPGAPGAEACAACLDAHCAPQLAAYVEPSACGDYIACVCPGGVPTASAAAVDACQTQVVEPACVQAATSVDVCEDSACSSACSGTSEVADGGDAAVVSTGGSLVDASLSPTCERYVQCCELALEDAGPTATIQTDCEESASLLTDPQCEAYIVAYQDAGVACPL